MTSARSTAGIVGQETMPPGGRVSASALLDRAGASQCEAVHSAQRHPAELSSLGGVVYQTGQAKRRTSRAETNPEPNVVESSKTNRPVEITAAAILISVILHLRIFRTSQFRADEQTIFAIIIPRDRTPLLRFAHHVSTGLFQGIFAEPGKWLRRSSRLFRRRPRRNSFTGLRVRRDIRTCPRVTRRRVRRRFAGPAEAQGTSPGQTSRRALLETIKGKSENWLADSRANFTDPFLQEDQPAGRKIIELLEQPGIVGTYFNVT